MERDPAARLAALVRGAGPSTSLDEALLLIAAHLDPEVDLDWELARLDDLAAGVAEPSLEGVRAHLYDHLGFAGDDDTYYDVRNSLLPAVLDRRRGIPITLAVLAMEVGRRAGVVIEGVGMPGHFLARDPRQRTRLLDPFTGTWLDVGGARARFEQLAPGAPWDELHLRSSPPADIVLRVLANLAGAQRRAGDRDGLCRTLDLRLRLPGATTGERRELGLLLGASGRFDEGAEVLAASEADVDQEAAARLRARLN